MRKILLVGTVILISSSLLLGSCFKKQAETGPVTLSFYGLDNADVWEPVISQYKSRRPSVTIRYKKFNNPEEFENLLINEIAEGEGPDIFYMHNTWLPRHIKKTVPLQSTSLTPDAFKEVFVKVAEDDFVQPTPSDGVRRIYSLPLYVDTLALYYNKSDYERVVPERGRPASTWNVIKDEADKFRQLDSEGKLSSGAIALGRSDNIKLAPDILYNLFLQAGVDFYDREFKRVSFASGGQNMFDYFVSFAMPQNKNFSWSLDSVPADKPLAEVEAFLSHKVSAIFGYSDLYQKLENDLKNVSTRSLTNISMRDIGVMQIPQMGTDSGDFKVWSNYYGLTVSRNSRNAATAWDFIQFATSKEKAKTYHQKTKRPTARRDLIEDQKKESVTEVFVSQLGYAASYRIFSDKLFADLFRKAVQDANGGRTAMEALGAAQTAINDILEIEAPRGLYPPVPKKKK